MGTESVSAPAGSASAVNRARWDRHRAINRRRKGGTVAARMTLLTMARQTIGGQNNTEPRLNCSLQPNCCHSILAKPQITYHAHGNQAIRVLSEFFGYGRTALSLGNFGHFEYRPQELG